MFIVCYLCVLTSRNTQHSTPLMQPIGIFRYLAALSPMDISDNKEYQPYFPRPMRSFFYLLEHKVCFCLSCTLSFPRHLELSLLLYCLEQPTSKARYNFHFYLIYLHEKYYIYRLYLFTHPFVEKRLVFNTATLVDDTNKQYFKLYIVILITAYSIDQGAYIDI